MIVFHNPGLIDLDAALTLGVSVKEGDSPIGYFGTGLKFAIATILRNGGSVVMWRGVDRHEFTAEPATIRGEEFHMICMDGKRLGFTTMLGRNWEPWMAFRELASNCRDEGGRYFQSDATGTSAMCADHAEGHTTFMVAGLDDIWPERGTILLEGEPIARNDDLEILQGGSPHVFYRGVRAATPMRPFAFTYNMRCEMKLTEDRTLANVWDTDSKLVKAICRLPDRALIRRILTVGDEYHEGNLSFEMWLPEDAGQAFTEVAEELVLGKELVRGVPQSLMRWVYGRQMKRLGDNPQSIQLSTVHQGMLDRAKAMLARGGYVIEDFPIIYTDALGPGVHGKADGGRIFISKLAFEKGTRELAATLFEEYAHLKSGQSDETRGFQEWLIDRVLISIETAAGEAF